MQILVVDDSSGMRRILAATLARLGFPRPIEAEDARAALAELDRGRFDLVIIDQNMPGMSGLDLARAIRRAPATRELPLLMVTGNGASDDVVRALRTGFGGYIVKPFTEETLAQQLGLSFGFTMERAANPDLRGPMQLARFACNDLPGGSAPLWEPAELFKRAPRREWVLHDTPHLVA